MTWKMHGDYREKELVNQYGIPDGISVANAICVLFLIENIDFCHSLLFQAAFVPSIGGQKRVSAFSHQSDCYYWWAPLEPQLDYELTKDTPYIAITGELWYTHPLRKFGEYEACITVFKALRYFRIEIEKDDTLLGAPFIYMALYPSMAKW